MFVVLKFAPEAGIEPQFSTLKGWRHYQSATRDTELTKP